MFFIQKGGNYTQIQYAPSGHQTSIICQNVRFQILDMQRTVCVSKNLLSLNPLYTFTFNFRINFIFATLAFS